MTQPTIPAAAMAQATNTLELVARDLATISRTRPEIGALLDDVGVTRNLQRALDLLAGATQR